MAGLMLNDTDVTRLAATVNSQQAAGYAPAGGLIIVNGVFFQYMVTGDNGGVAYSTVFTQSDIAFQEEASVQAGSGLGTCQFLNGWFVQAFGAEASSGVAWDDITGKPATFAPIVGTEATQAMAGNKTLADIGGVVPAAGLPKAAATPDLAPDADLPTTVAKVNDLLAALRTAGYVTP